MSHSITALLKHPLVFRGREQQNAIKNKRSYIPFGQKELDVACAGGAPASGVIRLRALPGSNELNLFSNILQTKMASEKRFIWIYSLCKINHKWLMQKPFFKQSWILKAPLANDALWACEQAIRSQACACIVMYFDNLTSKAARRLQVLSKQYDCLVIVISIPSPKDTVLPVNMDATLYYEQPHWLIQLDRISGAWPQQNIAIENPLPASNQAIIRAFSHSKASKSSNSKVS